MHGPIGEGHESYKPIRPNMTKFYNHQRRSLVLESGRRRRALDVKSRTVRPKVENLRPKVQQLDDTLRQSQCWAHENNRREWRPCIIAEVGVVRLGHVIGNELCLFYFCGTIPT
jgi:hypothetical protein